MPLKDPVLRAKYNKRYLKKHYSKNKTYYLDKNRKRRESLTIWVNNLKKYNCTDCGEFYPHYVMDFDHRENTIKILPVSIMVNNGYSKISISKEIEKCDLVCANCHRERTQKRLRSSVMVTRLPLEREILGSTPSSSTEDR